MSFEASYSDSEDEERSLSSDRVPRFRNIFNLTKTKWNISSSARKVNNFVPASEVSENCSLAARKTMSRFLKADARRIARFSSQAGTAVLCVILRKKKTPGSSSSEVWKKFVLTNLYELDGGHGVKKEQSSLVQAAHDLNYHVVQAQQSHAEMGLLQFLEERRHVYHSEPVSMGCNRGVCKLCSEMLDIEWGCSWNKWFNCKDFSSAIHQFWFTPSALINIVMKEPERTEGFRKTNDYLIPEYAGVWATSAPDYFGCTDVDGNAVWECSEKKACWRHGPGLELKDRIPESHPYHKRLPFTIGPPNQEKASVPRSVTTPSRHQPYWQQQAGGQAPWFPGPNGGVGSRKRPRDGGGDWQDTRASNSPAQGWRAFPAGDGFVHNGGRQPEPPCNRRQSTPSNWQPHSHWQQQPSGQMQEPGWRIQQSPLQMQQPRWQMQQPASASRNGQRGYEQYGNGEPPFKRPRMDFQDFRPPAPPPPPRFRGNGRFGQPSEPQATMPANRFGPMSWPSSNIPDYSCGGLSGRHMRH